MSDDAFFYLDSKLLEIVYVRLVVQPFFGASVTIPIRRRRREDPIGVPESFNYSFPIVR